MEFLGAFDLVVVGVGLNGAAIARDAVGRGLSVLLDRIASTGGAAFFDRLARLPDYTHGEIQALVRSEQVVALADLVFRRTPIAIAGRLTLAAIEELGEIVGAELQWTSDERRREIGLTLAIARDQHGVRLSSPMRAAQSEAA
jgi:glycerol-3-phosphate dehydrogenase